MATMAALRGVPEASSDATSAPQLRDGRRALGRGRRPGDDERDLAAGRILDRPGGELAQPAAADLLVRLGQLPAERGRPVRAERGGQVGQGVVDPVRRLEEDQRARLGGEPANTARRSPVLRGGKPSKQNRSEGRPDRARAVVTALGPGAEVTGTPAASAARTSRNPGSETLGMPPSVITRDGGAAGERGDQFRGTPLLVALEVGHDPAADR